MNIKKIGLAPVTAASPTSSPVPAPNHTRSHAEPFCTVARPGPQDDARRAIADAIAKLDLVEDPAERAALTAPLAAALGVLTSLGRGNVDLRPKQAAARLGLSVSRVRALCAAGRLGRPGRRLARARAAGAARRRAARGRRGAQPVVAGGGRALGRRPAAAGRGGRAPPRPPYDAGRRSPPGWAAACAGASPPCRRTPSRPAACSPTGTPPPPGSTPPAPCWPAWSSSTWSPT